MTTIRITRDATIPDDLRVARALSAPHVGPRVLFFSGGSALNAISRRLKRYSYNSIHLITPFDSGGSSQQLRQAFDMPAVGDLRSRLMALADESDLGQPDIFALFTHRLPGEGPQELLQAQVQEMVAGRHRLIQAVARPMRSLIETFLQHFAAHVPADFDYRNASIGNLILAGGYMMHDRALEPVLFLMSKMVDVRGTVRAVVDANLQLGVELTDGSHVIGQRAISGKEVAPLARPIRRAFISDPQGGRHEAIVDLPDRNRKLISQADIICYPPGSLYSSVVANLLPRGTGAAIATRAVPKLYLPSLGTDPEALGHSLYDQVSAILSALRADAGDAVPASHLMSHVLCDNVVPVEDCSAVQRTFGIPCTRLPLTSETPGRYDPEKVCELLLSLS